MRLASQQFKREEAARQRAESGCVWAKNKKPKNKKKHLWETGPFDEELISFLKPLRQVMLLIVPN